MDRRPAARRARQKGSVTMINRLSIIRLGAIAALLAGPAAADEQDASAPGQARSTSFSAFAPDVPITVRPLDNSQANLALREHFAEALKRRSLRVGEIPAPLVLNFETEVDQTIRRGWPTLATATGGNREAEVRVDVWSTRQDGTPRGRAADLPDRGILRYVLTATLDDEHTGRRVWQGEATYSSAPADEAATLAAMAAILVDQLGQTVRQRSFRIE
jgi:hypothetical protein